jgi:hypothetical protein
MLFNYNELPILDCVRAMASSSFCAFQDQLATVLSKHGPFKTFR